jgi:hypothetical protein
LNGQPVFRRIKGGVDSRFHITHNHFCILKTDYKKELSAKENTIDIRPLGQVSFFFHQEVWKAREVVANI